MLLTDEMNHGNNETGCAAELHLLLTMLHKLHMP